MPKKDKNKSPDSSPHDKENKDTGKIVTQNIVSEMETAYLDYAMSVIVARALPDARDGLKPVHRRILMTMHDLNLSPGGRFRKCAKIAGDVSGNYHPHGEAIVYPSLVRMAQSFAMRYPLVNGQGNFGSIDGDAPAAMRYTEAKMAPIATEMLRDIEKDTVDFVPNYDNTREEPSVLPAVIPNLLLNGALGIAVGMATNIPPHNLGEVIDAVRHLIQNPKASVDDLIKFVKGPDFPTGGIIFNKKDIQQAYATGRGGVVTRGEAEIVEKKEEQFQIIITSIPYQTNKADLIIKIADLVRDKKIEGIKDIRDESDKEGLRIAVDLKGDTPPQKTLNILYKHTDLEKTYHFNMLALSEGIQPEVLSLKSLLEQFIKHRQVVIERRTKFDLTKAEDRVHILEGLKKALDQIDKIITAIRKSKDREEAHKNLMQKFKFTDKQSSAILDMRLSALANLERQKVLDELKEKQKLIRDLKELLKDPKKILEVISDELEKIKEKYGDERRTKIMAGAAQTISVEDMIPEEGAVLVITKGGYIKRINPSEYRSQKRGGKGLIGIETKDEDFVSILVSGNTHDNLLFFSNLGKAYQTKMYDIPAGKRTSKGKSVFNFLPLKQGEEITSVLVMPKTKNNEKMFLVMATEKGIIKKVEEKSFEDVRMSGIIAIKLQKNDALRFARVASTGDHIILATKKGQAIRFKESDARQMGRSAAGVRAIRLSGNDQIIGADVINEKEKETKFMIMSDKGYGKLTAVKNYRLQKRGGSGIKTANVTSKTGPLVSAKIITSEEELIAISKKGQVIRTSLESIPDLNRVTQGVRIMKLAEKDLIASLICF